jgi:hypothetical protein
MATEERRDYTSAGTTSVSQKLTTTASNRVRDALDTSSTQAADKITPYAEAFRRAGNHLEIQGSTSGAQTVGRIADQVQHVSDYLRRSNADTFLGDIESFARQRPWAAGGVGFLLGFMGARFLKASSETRYTSRYPSSAHPMAYDPSIPDTPLYRETEVGQW